MHVRGLVGWMSKRKCCRMGPKDPRGSIVKGTGILVKDVADGCDACCWVGLVVTSELLLFVFLSMRIGIGIIS